jgi:hypothetical protein
VRELEYLGDALRVDQIVRIDPPTHGAKATAVDRWFRPSAALV